MRASTLRVPRVVSEINDVSIKMAIRSKCAMYVLYVLFYVYCTTMRYVVVHSYKLSNISI